MKTKRNRTTNIVIRRLVQEVLKRVRTSDSALRQATGYDPAYQDTVVSLLIHDIFGGEILKTHKNEGWHFYNRINGERIDITGSTISATDDISYEDIPSSTSEPVDNFGREDYSTFFIRFVMAFEEAVGLGRLRLG
jgi:hypothetical protein